MNTKYSFRAIQQGQTQQSHVVQAGAGQNGQALVLRAAEGTRYQLADLLTLTSPKKLQLKRVGQDLLVALPGNDVSSPDIVIQDYFNFKDLSLSGLAATGEPMVYDTSSSFNFGQSATGIHLDSLASNQTTAAKLATASEGWFDSGWGLAALGGGLAVVAAAGGGGSASGNASLTKITDYKSDATKAVPTVSDFADAGVSGVDESNITGILSMFPRTQLSLKNAAGLQTLVNSFKKVVAEANGTGADATSDDPIATDYVNLMGANTPNSIITKPQALALLNDRVKALNTTEVDSYSEIKALADAVEAIAALAQSAPSTTGSATAGVTAAQLSSLGVEVTATSLSAVSDAIRASADNLSALNTTAKLTALVKAYNTILAEANGSAADATVSNPSAADYAAIGADIGAAKTDAAALARLNAIVGNLSSSAVDTVDEINKLATTLDKIQDVAGLASGATLSPAQIFSADELKNLGLTGFTSSEANNKALALAVSEAIRDKEVTDVNTLAQLKTLTSLSVLQAWARDVNPDANAGIAKTATAPTAQDYKDMGVVRDLPKTSAGVSQTALATLSTTDVNALNDAIDTLVDNSSGTTTDDILINTLSKVQGIAASYFKILNEANGSASDYTSGNSVQTTFGGAAAQGVINDLGNATDVTAIDLNTNPLAADYTRIGVTGAFDDARTSLLNTLIAEKTVAQVDTVKEIQALADTADKVLALAAKSGDTVDAADKLTLSQLQTDLGLSGVSSANLDAVLLAIQNTADDKTAADSIAELQGLVSLTRITRYADDSNASTNPGGVPTVFDWHAVTGLKSELDANVNAYNSAVDASTSTGLVGLSGLQALVSAYNDILAAADGNKLTAPGTGLALADYEQVLGTSSTAYTALTPDANAKEVKDLMVNANGGVSSDKVDTVAELSAMALAAGRVIALAAVEATANTNLTGTGNATNTAGVTKEDLTLLGLDTSKIGNGYSAYDSYELSNILAEIQNLSPSQASDLATLQLKVNAWALN